MSSFDDGSPLAIAVDTADVVTVVAKTSRRVPPPCWIDEETLALVNAYKEKWFALRRGNLRAADWDDVAAAVSSSASSVNPPKSAIQCRHKIEKLRKRYRAEKQRCLKRPGKFSSSWELFPLLDAMGFAPLTPAPIESYDPDPDHVEYSNGGVLDRSRNRSKNFGKSGVRSKANNHMKSYAAEFDSDHESGCGFRLKRKYNGNPKFSVDFDDELDDEVELVPKAIRSRAHGDLRHHSGGFPVKSYGDRNFSSPVLKSKNFSKSNVNFATKMDYDDDDEEDEDEDDIPSNDGFNTRIQNARVNSYRKDGIYHLNTSGSNGYGLSSRFENEQKNVDMKSDPIDEVVSSIKMLTKMFARVEKSKMEMMREMEKTRMEMELKHCQMMLDSQQQIIGAFAEASSKKKSKNTSRPKSRLMSQEH